MIGYINRLQAEYNFNTNKYIDIKEHIEKLIPLCKNLFLLLESTYVYEEVIFTEFICEVNDKTVNIWIGFFTSENNSQFELEFPKIFENNEFPLYSVNKYANVISTEIIRS